MLVDVLILNGGSFGGQLVGLRYSFVLYININPVQCMLYTPSASLSTTDLQLKQKHSMNEKGFYLKLVSTGILNLFTKKGFQ